MGEKVAEEGLEAKELDPPNLSATLPHLREPPGCGPSSGTMGSLGPHHLLSQGLSFPICIEGRLIDLLPSSPMGGWRLQVLAKGAWPQGCSGHGTPRPQQEGEAEHPKQKSGFL